MSNPIIDTQSDSLASALRHLLAENDEELGHIDTSAYPSCPHCTHNTTPISLDQGPCPFHQAKIALSKHTEAITLHVDFNQIGANLARMVTDYVTTGTRLGTDWRNGLADVIALRARRLYAGKPGRTQPEDSES